MSNFSIEALQSHLLKALENKTQEYQRAFHGRGGLYEGFEFLTVDFIDKLLYVALFEPIDEVLEKEIIEVMNHLFKVGSFETTLLQKRYLKQESNTLLHGTLPKEVIAIENGLKFHLNIANNQNIGLFADMKCGREFVKAFAKDKTVLNLFSYTCAFSVYASSGGASKVVNVDMAKNALSTGRANHHLNELSTKIIEFMPYNILKSWNRIKKSGPYDMIIIDPPSFQKGSFAATKDYVKIIKRLEQLTKDECLVLACLNDPKLNTQFIKDIFSEHAPAFVFEQRLPNLTSFASKNEEHSLKNLIFIKKSRHD